jgi:hypothetical protein
MNRRMFFKLIGVGAIASIIPSSILPANTDEPPYRFCFDHKHFKAMDQSDIYRFIEVGLRYELPDDIDVLVVETLYSATHIEYMHTARGLVKYRNIKKYWAAGYDAHMFTHDYKYRVGFCRDVAKQIKNTYRIW